MITKKSGEITYFAATCENNNIKRSHAVTVFGPAARDRLEARELARQAGWLIVGKYEYCPKCAVTHARSAHLPMRAFQNAVVVRGAIEDIARDLATALRPNDMDALVDLLDELRGSRIAPSWRPLDVLQIGA